MKSKDKSVSYLKKDGRSHYNDKYLKVCFSRDVRHISKMYWSTGCTLSQMFDLDRSSCTGKKKSNFENLKNLINLGDESSDFGFYILKTDF